MLMCWNEQPLRRPTFTELRSKFDAMLLADKNEDYIDLRIDQSKLYYQLMTTTSHVNGGSSRSDLKMRSSSDVTLMSHGSQNGNTEGVQSKSPSIFIEETSGGMKSSCASCIDQVGTHQSRPQFLTLDRGRDARHRKNGEMFVPGRDRTYENAGRPVSMYQSSNMERGKRQNNPYVDEPSVSRITGASRMLSDSNLKGHPTKAQWRSDGAIEMSPMDGYVEMKGKDKVQNGQPSGPEIKISSSEDT